MSFSGKVHGVEQPHAVLGIIQRHFHDHAVRRRQQPMDSLDGRDAAPGRPPGLPIRRVEDSRDLSRGKVRYSSISKAGSVRSEADGVIFQPQKERRQAGGINVVHGEVGANDLHVGVRRVCHEAATPLGECEVHAALEIIGCKWRVRIQMHLERPVRRIDSLHSAAAL